MASLSGMSSGHHRAEPAGYFGLRKAREGAREGARPSWASRPDPDGALRLGQGRGELLRWPCSGPAALLGFCPETPLPFIFYGKRNQGPEWGSPRGQQLAGRGRNSPKARTAQWLPRASVSFSVAPGPHRERSGWVSGRNDNSPILQRWRPRPRVAEHFSSRHTAGKDRGSAGTRGLPAPKLCAPCTIRVLSPPSVTPT